MTTKKTTASIQKTNNGAKGKGKVMGKKRIEKKDME
jgi:hypothetical protein